mmetsp:Transcript_31417/g.59770  ORF Transcript_31417/g.59770 Transcript_31417/m.59770 type:complete len:95 (-) Transcript_31417:2950-3234(-)
MIVSVLESQGSSSALHCIVNITMMKLFGYLWSPMSVLYKSYTSQPCACMPLFECFGHFENIIERNYSIFIKIKRLEQFSQIFLRDCRIVSHVQH